MSDNSKKQSTTADGVLDCSGLLNAIKLGTKQSPSQQSAIVIGTVLSISPFSVSINGLTIPNSLLLVSPFVQDLEFSESSLLRKHKHETIHGSSEEATWEGTTSYLWKGVTVGESVVCLRTGQGQQWLVLYPVEGIHTEQ